MTVGTTVLDHTRAQLGKAFEDLKNGQSVLVKSMHRTMEPAILDESRIITKDDQANDANYHRYAFDWKRMKKDLSESAIEYYKQFETPSVRLNNGTITGNVFWSKGNRVKSHFIGWTRTDAKATTYTFVIPAEQMYNRWIESQTNSKGFCKVKVIALEWFDSVFTIRVWYKKLRVK